MKIQPQLSTLLHANHMHRAFAGCFCSLALILRSALMCQAQTPTPCPDFNPPHPTPEPLAPEFQPSHYAPNDTTVMYHIKFKPGGTGPWPTVLMLPPALFRNGYASGSAKERVATKDLTAAGFLVFQIEHRLAPDGLLEGQTSHCNPEFSPCPIIQQASGRPPQQTDDVKQQILAALDDDDCNDTIFLIGGSSGGCHALWVALDATAGNITDWTPAVRGKIKGVVGLSAPTDLPLRDHDEGVDIDHFADTVENYTNTHGAQNWLQTQQAASPISLVANATNIPPIRLYATQGDSVPWQQAREMYNALFNHGGVDVLEYKMDGSEHCFNYWHMINNLTGKCVSEEVIEFLQDQL